MIIIIIITTNQYKRDSSDILVGYKEDLPNKDLTINTKTTTTITITITITTTTAAI